MKNKIINNVMFNISNNYTYSNTKLAEIKYGLESLYLTITKFTVIITICLLLNVFKEFLLFMAAFGLLKVTGFGLHTKKSWQCWITSVPIFTIIPYLIKNIIINDYVLWILLTISFILICIYAPSDTEKRPLIRANKRRLYKIITIITSVIYIMLIVFINNSYLTSVLFYSLLLLSLIINPISYMLFELRYKNYLYYNMKGGNTK